MITIWFRRGGVDAENDYVINGKFLTYFENINRSETYILVFALDSEVEIRAKKNSGHFQSETKIDYFLF